MTMRAQSHIKAANLLHVPANSTKLNLLFYL
jgi:hypothetical protein